MSDTELQIVTGLETARISALTTQDADTLERLLSDSMVYVHSTGMVDTKRSFIDNVRNGPIQYRAVERHDVEGHLAGDGTAVFTGTADAKVEFKGSPIDLRFRFLAVWAKHGDAWRFEAWHSASIAD